MIVDVRGRRFQVYERVPEGPEARRRPRHAWFFLVDDEHSDVFASADALKLDQFRKLVYLSSGELVVYSGAVKQIRNRAFVSLRALGEGRPEYETARVKVLEGFRNCREIVDSFD